MYRLTAIFLFLGLSAAMNAATVAEPRSQVYFATESTATDGIGRVSQSTVQRMVDALIVAATRQSSPQAAWRSLVSPEDVVGIKVSTSGGRTGGVRPEVVRAISTGLQSAGIPKENILVWDRNREDLQLAGFSMEDPHFHLRWIDPRNGYDSDAILTAPVIGKLIWGDRQFGDRTSSRLVDLLSTGDQLSSRSHYAKILSREVTKVINVASLQDSFMTGVNGAMVSMTIGNIDNWRRFTRSPHHGDPYVAEIFADEMISGKVVIHFMDALWIQFAGGPFPNPNFTVEQQMLLVSKDPVALDATARKFIDDLRAENRLPKIRPISGYLESAEYYGLGVADERRIDLIRIGQPET